MVKMKKMYQVFYWIKKDNHEFLHHIFVNAENAKDACKVAKQVVREKTGRNAFRPTTKAPSEAELAALRKNPYYVVD